ncbi:alpha/beta hydrolase [Clostridiaceae bacterium OttesenSCG-928-D20]|nr:alpha/beta hydrolase [Clostridiaceae bacterium OttesenSCG-928-D20]
MKSFTFLSTDGSSKINCQKWLPETEPVGIVQIAHGVSEHIERYAEFAEHLTSQGYIVVANDHLGHGKSASSHKGFFAEKNGWNLVVDDCCKLSILTKKEHPSLPYFLFGHSMGSFVARTFIIKYPDELDGVILSGTGQQAPALISSGSLLAKMVISRKGASYQSPLIDKIAYGSYNKTYPNAKTKFDWLSTDEEVVSKYIEDENCGFLSSAGLFRDMLGGIDFAGRMENISKMRKSLPVLFIAGNDDPVGDYGKAVLEVYHRFIKAGMQNASLKLYAGGRHEMLNEKNKSEVFEDVSAWLNRLV